MSRVRSPSPAPILFLFQFNKLHGFLFQFNKLHGVEAVTGPCRESGAISKVIIEASLLTDDEKIAACTLAKAAAADFVKTSTGFGPGGATVADVALMRKVVGAEMGVKAAGGVRDLDGLKAMVAAGATRIGASAGVRIVQQSGGNAPAGPGTGY